MAKVENVSYYDDLTKFLSNLDVVLQKDLVNCGLEESTASQLFPIMEYKLISPRNNELLKVDVAPDHNGLIYSGGILLDWWSDNLFNPL